MENVMKKLMIGEETKVMRSDDVMRKLESTYGSRAARSFFAIAYIPEHSDPPFRDDSEP